MNLDNLNLSILNELMHNSRITNTELGKKIGLTSPAVAERIKKMEEAGIIKSYSIDVDYEQLGINENVIIGIDIQYCNIPKFIEEVENINGVISVMKSTGDFCVIVHLIAKNMSKLEEVITKFSKHGNTSTFRILGTPYKSVPKVKDLK
ncbi:Lrp/AsnC family transcriptional regulator, leucine-responsive regulatory protein [Chishuiella changwenlii]|jgi:Lrp/AsnC family leucine-responsive transcriptional regulator|uniref:AsnC family transcriptional regulator n=1 Tax=Chishuiella changwenlii TaxID=1434701 RepID=A0A1M6Z8F9_9FLAO|nr:Lrp/AsnC family transcriptional regulator [Chishuiella changwenlii]GGE86839.1 AsnC family transcriptional regulator [Chishuiella changwenlii]SHL26748.1 Lrp/AsnC family transcriptional regulator, leucine-responsive regulatory protein [Chishuiella changwenlii]